MTGATALAAAPLGGMLLACAFPDLGWWWAAPLGVALQLLALAGRSGTGALAVGFAGGFGFYGALILWTTLFLGPVPFLALTTLQALLVMVGATLIAKAYDWLPRRWPGPVGRFLALPIGVGGLWTLREAVAGTWPYGGFAWGRVAQSQSASPFGELVSWLGLSGLSFLLVTLTAIGVEALRAWIEAREVSAPMRSPAVPLLTALGRAGAVACGVALLALVPVFPTTSSGSLRIAAVQGATPEASYFLRGDSGSVIRAHLDGTAGIPDDADVDLVLWPEGSIDVNLARGGDAVSALEQQSARLEAPIVVNGATAERDPVTGEVRYFNSSFVWTASGPAGIQVDKQHPIPFAEYVPDRDFWYPLAPGLIGMLNQGYTPGEAPAVLDVAGVPMGLFICYDIVDDGAITNAVEAGGEILLAPTNNADFGRTAELAQQLAFARLRAMETGRAVVQVSTVGDSAVYLPDGSELSSLPRYERGVMVVEVPRSTTLTPATAIGRELEWLTAGAGAVLLIASRLGGRRPPRHSSAWETVPRR